MSDEAVFKKLIQRYRTWIFGMPGIDIERDIISTNPMKILVPENNDVPVIEPSIITGQGFRVKWQKDG